MTPSTIIRPVLTATAAAAALLVLQAPATRAAETPACAPHGNEPAFSLALRALTGPDGAELDLHVTPAQPGCTAPDSLKKVQLKTFALDGSPAPARNLVDVAAPGGAATVVLGDLLRGQRVAADVLVQSGEPERTYVLRGETTVLLRPDLVVRAVTAPHQVLRGRSFRVEAEIEERNGDVGATATVGISGGGTQPVAVTAGGRATVGFTLALQQTGATQLEITISDAAPRETDTSNNTARTTIEVTDFELAPQQVLVPSLLGYGGQFNQHVYAKLSMPPVTFENVLELESKVTALQPQFVRIFFNLTEFTFADRMDSFVRTVQLAQRAGATINITYQGGGTSTPDASMKRFADVLTDLLKNRGIPNLWVTVQNDVNSTRITMALYESLYRSLDKYLRANGVRERIQFMGGDLTAAKSPLGQTQKEWFDFLATNMADLLDAWAIHVAWDYWDTPKIERRLTEVRAIWDGEPVSGRKPLYVSEYDVRGIKTCAGVIADPGAFDDCTPLAKTNINAFQHAVLTVRSAQLGYAGASKWDSYFGKYDNGTQAYYMIGSPLEGWPLNPVYYVTQLLTQTTRRGWKVIGIDGSSGTKLLAAYAGSAGEVTIVGLDTAGATSNTASTSSSAYSLGGLPAATTFRLTYWNKDGGGALTTETVTSDDAGVVQLEAPLTSVFALTTLA